MILSKRQLFCIHFLKNQPHLTPKRASFCISKEKRKKGSITVETALVLPFFFLSIICLLYLMEVMTIRINIQSGLYYAVKQIAEETVSMPVMRTSEIKEAVVQAIGKERLDRSVVVNGSEGLQCDKSHISIRTGIIEATVTYKVSPPIPIFARITVPMEESLRMKGWCGYTRTGLDLVQDETVYITENGMVYHRDLGCPYLELSIKGVGADAVTTVRNQNGEKYTACERCVKGNGTGLLFVTEYGNKYHGSLTCSGLKRTIQAVSIHEVAGKGVCSKCGS